jgi:DNA-binding NtrC family response regulator
LPTPPLEVEPPMGKATILLVEDDHSLRELMLNLLQGHGYTVLASANVSDAVNLAQDAKSEVDLLLSDVVLPDLSGDELSALLRNLRPNLRVLLTSEYAGDLITRYQSIDPTMTLIAKPFTRRGLLSTIDRVLRADNQYGARLFDRKRCGLVEAIRYSLIELQRRWFGGAGGRRN